MLSKRPRIVFMGTPEYAVPSLRSMVSAGLEVVAVVTQPDRPKGRGRKPLPPPVKRAALEMGIPALQPVRVSEPAFCEEIARFTPDILVVVAFGQILKESLLRIPRWGSLNIHASLLPRYRGPAPIQWAILKEERRTGLTAMHMDQGLDTGPILLQEALPIGPEETAGELHDRLSRLSGPFLIKSLERLMAGTWVETPQDEALATYAPKITKGFSVVSWEDSARRIAALIRGLDPSPGAVTRALDRDIKVFSARVAQEGGSGWVPGRVHGQTREGILVETGDGMVEIRELQAPGRKRMSGPEFLRGFRLEQGERLGL